MQTVKLNDVKLVDQILAVMTLTLKRLLINRDKCNCNFLDSPVDLVNLVVPDLNCCVTLMGKNQNLYFVDYRNDVDLLQMKRMQKNKMNFYCRRMTKEDTKKTIEFF